MTPTRSNRSGRAGVGTLVALVVAAVLAGCANKPHRAPVEDRVATPRAAIPPAVAASSTSATTSPVVSGGEPTASALPPPPGSENAGKPGYYAVKPGDTLMRISLDNGQSWKDLVKWNGLDNPNVIEVGQVLRVAPPGNDPALAQTRAVTVAKVDSKPLAPAAAGAVPTAVAASAPTATVVTTGTGAAPAPPVSSSSPIAVAASPSREADDDVRWGWPASGGVLAPFDEGKVKGLVIGGRAGDPVLAAADGRVVYAGSGLRGYGNLVILKHNSTYLTAYAHNQVLLVKEDQNVKRGQKIAEMGSSDAEGVRLHFEIRRQGKPVDPAKLLPPR